MSDLPPSLRDRVLQAAAMRPAPTRRAFRWRRMGAISATAMILGLIAVSEGVPCEPGIRPDAHVAVAAAFSALIAVIAGAVALLPIRSPLWRPAVRFRMAWAVPVYLVLASFIANLVVPETLRWPVKEVMAHLRCLMASTMIGGAVLALFVRLERGIDPVAPRATGASLGAVAGAWAALVLSIRCPHPDPAHVIATHVLPVAALVVVGAAAGARWIALQWDSSMHA